jgi:hypothetical protein
MIALCAVRINMGNGQVTEALRPIMVGNFRAGNFPLDFVGKFIYNINKQKHTIRRVFLANTVYPLKIIT